MEKPTYMYGNLGIEAVKKNSVTGQVSTPTPILSKEQNEIIRKSLRDQSKRFDDMKFDPEKLLSDIKSSKLSHPIEMEKEIDYKFNEGQYIDDLKTYIDKTYTQHYAVGKLQATEFIIDMGDGLGFTRGNVIKYAKRYGQKAGYNRDDLMKVLHYALMMLYVHDNYIIKE